MPGFFDRILGRGSNRDNRSAPLAKERLKFVLVHDRINLPPERLQEMKAEILAVISRYVSVNVEDVDIALEQRDRTSNRIIAEIPFSQVSPIEDGTNPDLNMDDEDSTPPPIASSDAP